MKTKLKVLTVVGWLFGAVIQLHAQGYILPDGVRFTGLNFAGGYEIRVRQNPTNGDYTGFWLTPRNKTQPTALYTNIFMFDGYVDEGARVFLVASNQPISLEPILVNSYAELIFPNSYVFTSSSPFYVGLYTGHIYPENGIYPDPLFGWARLLNNHGVIELLDGALGYNARGIYAGTRNFVPEPSVFALVGLGASSLFLFRRKRSFFKPG